MGIFRRERRDDYEEIAEIGDDGKFHYQAKGNPPPGHKPITEKDLREMQKLAGNLKSMKPGIPTDEEIMRPINEALAQTQREIDKMNADIEQRQREMEEETRRMRFGD